MTSPADARRHDRACADSAGTSTRVLEQPRRSVSDRLVRPHRIHRHEHVDRSVVRAIRDLSLEPTASRRHRRRRRAARPGCDGRGRGDLDGSTTVHAWNRRPEPSVRNRRAEPLVRNLRAEPPVEPVLTGIDVLARDGFKQLRGKRVGLVTNHTGRSRDGKATIDLLHTAPGVKLVCAVQSRARHPRRARCRCAGDEGREDRPADSLAVLQGRHRAAASKDRSPASTRWSSICRTSASASTPISSRWAT